MTGVPIVCFNCGNRGVVNRVTASLRCSCGSTDIDLDDSGIQTVAYPHGPGTGWGQPQDLTRGWSDYEGPLPSPNPASGTVPPVNDSMRCPSCHGSGYDTQDKTLCRECNGAGVVKRSTGQPDVETNDATSGGPPVGGARWQGTAQAMVTSGSGGTVTVFGGGGGAGGWGLSTPESRVAARVSLTDPAGSAEYQNRHGAPGYTIPEEQFTDRSKNVDYREPRDYGKPTDKPYQMHQATCPNCGHAPTELRKDRNEDAWWHCPSCGPLANIDKHPDIDPYSPPKNFQPDRSMKTSKLRRNHKTGKLISIIATVQDHNDLSIAEALAIARTTLLTYPEDSAAR